MHPVSSSPVKSNEQGRSESQQDLLWILRLGLDIISSDNISLRSEAEWPSPSEWPYAEDYKQKKKEDIAI